MNNEEKLKIAIQLPITNAEVIKKENVIIQKSNSADYSIANEIFDGGVRTSVILSDNNAPSEYPIKYDLPEGCFLRFAEGPNDNGAMTQDGSVEVVANNGDVIGAILLPWAKDNLGNEVNTYYKIENDSTLIQVVEHKEKNYEYPIVADPTAKFKRWFSKTTWIKRNGKMSLSIHYKKQLLLESTRSVENASWTEVYKANKGSKHWSNTGGMRDQYICHLRFARSKNPWNIEPWRPNVSFAGTVLKACNP